MSYNQFIHGLKKAAWNWTARSLADLAVKIPAL
jgi:ribosomal protein L20